MITTTVKKVFGSAILGSAMAVASMSGYAADNGDVGATSQGEIGVTLEIPALIRIHSLEDVDLGTFDATLSASELAQFCVWGNVAAYNITITSANATNPADETTPPRLQRGTSGEYIPYDVHFKSGAVAALNTDPVSTAGALPGSTAGGTIATDCTNASLLMEVDSADIENSTVGTYVDVLTLLVNPV
ncbi:MAG: hypothetical protein COB04_07215 [Gammaproteobacteria bacterium]|nr:MAG: hypothetical protein COB04_07215 [Gammaproteobacteria bacterium]